MKQCLNKLSALNNALINSAAVNKIIYYQETMMYVKLFFVDRKGEGGGGGMGKYNLYPNVQTFSQTFMFGGILSAKTFV